MTIPLIMSHVSASVSDLSQTFAFDHVVLEALNAKRLVQDGDATTPEKECPEFRMSSPLNGAKPPPGNGLSVAFFAVEPERADAFSRAAGTEGASVTRPLGPQRHDGTGCAGCFVHGSDDCEIEATFCDMGAA